MTWTARSGVAPIPEMTRSILLVSRYGMRLAPMICSTSTLTPSALPIIWPSSMSKPVGSTEQHGPHLPVMVDYRLATEVARRGAVKLAAPGPPVLVTPTVGTGFAEHPLELGGPTTPDYSVFHGLLPPVVPSLAPHPLPP